MRRGKEGNINFPCSVDHVQDWQPYPVDPHSAMCTYLHLFLCGVMGGRRRRGRPGILPAIFVVFLHPIKGHLQLSHTVVVNKPCNKKMRTLTFEILQLERPTTHVENIFAVGLAMIPNPSASYVLEGKLAANLGQPYRV